MGARLAKAGLRRFADYSEAGKICGSRRHAASERIISASSAAADRFRGSSSFRLLRCFSRLRSARRFWKIFE
jgi:hypothetical protein